MRTPTIRIDIRKVMLEQAKRSAKTEPKNVPSFGNVDPTFFFDHAYDAILLADFNGNVWNANNRALLFFGLKADEITGVGIGSLVAGMDEALLKKIREAVTVGERHLRIQAFAYRAESSCTAVEVVAICTNEEGSEKPSGVCYLIRDTQALWESQRRLQTAHHAMDNTDIGICVVDLGWEVTYANQTALDMFGDGKPENVVGQSIGKWIDPGNDSTSMRNTILRKQSWKCEKRVLYHGVATWGIVSAIPDFDIDGNLIGAIISFQDIGTIQQAYILQRKEECYNATMDAFGEAAHALGQPATVLLSSMELLRQCNNMDEENRKQMIDMAYEAALQIRECLKQMNVKRREAVIAEQKANDAKQ